MFFEFWEKKIYKQIKRNETKVTVNIFLNFLRNFAYKSDEEAVSNMLC